MPKPIHVVVENKSPNRIWYRILNEHKQYRGNDVGPGETIVETLPQDWIQVQKIDAMVWEKGDPEVWKPTFSNQFRKDETGRYRLTITNLFGPRFAQSIKAYMACLAGPADPLSRSDIKLMDMFAQKGVPRENIWMLLERQCTPKSICATLSDAASGNVCQEGDILFVYLGGHGSSRNNGYELCSWQGRTSSKMILEALQGTKARVFMVVDSCSSGIMIEDAIQFFKNKPKISILSSTHATETTYTGWKIVDNLLKWVSGNEYFTDQTIGKHIAATLKTSNPQQKARYYDFES